jgi:hypothetical protein
MMKDRLIVIGGLAMFALMVTDPYLMTWGLIIYSVTWALATHRRRWNEKKFR